MTITALQFARLAAFLDHDFEETVVALVEDFGMTEADAREGLRTAVRERQEKDITDTHDDLLGGTS